MKLGLPLGLLGLLGLVALILIYILKPKYQDKKISSTYIWKLSLNYRKQKLPFQWLKNSLILMLQILTIICIAFMMTQPRIVLNTKNGEKIVILDASAAMLAEDNGVTRFEKAKRQISRLAEVTAESDKFTVILAADEASFAVRRSDSVSYIKQKIADAECTFLKADMPSAMKLAEGVLTENPNAEVILYTCKDYADSGRVTVVNTASSEWNAAVLDFSAKLEKGLYTFTAEIASYGKNSEIAAGLTVDGEAMPLKLADCKDGNSVKVIWNSDLTDYRAARVNITANDAFPYDNEFYSYNPTGEKFKVQLISESPGFLYAALVSTERCVVDIPNGEDGEKTEGYDLYVYDNYVPETLPDDGALWFLNPPENLLELGVYVDGKYRGNYNFSGGSGSTDTYKKIMDGITPSDISATEYSNITRYTGFESLMRCNGDPVLLAKQTGTQKAVIFGFDIHMTDLPVLPDFSVLIKNLCGYSVADTVEKTLYETGETVDVNAKTTAESLTVTANYIAGKSEENAYSDYPVTIDANAPGAYKVVQQLKSGRTVTDGFFVRIARSESVFGKTEKTLINPVVLTTVGSDTDIENDTLDIFVYVAAGLLVIMCVEWGVHYREEY